MKPSQEEIKQAIDFFTKPMLNGQNQLQWLRNEANKFRIKTSCCNLDQDIKAANYIQILINAVT